MPVPHVLNMADPIVGQSDTGICQRSRNAAAGVMAHHHDVPDLQVFDGELYGGQCIQIGVHDHVGHVPVHEHFPGLESRDLVGRHPAVGATDPHELRGLLLDKVAEKTRSMLLHPSGPSAILGKENIDCI